MWFLRQMMRIPWTDKVRNEEVLKRAGTGMKLILEIRTKQMRFLVHLMRKDGLENLALIGKIEGKRSRGRKWSLWMANLNGWIGERGIKYQEVALFEKAREYCGNPWLATSLDMAHRARIKKLFLYAFQDCLPRLTVLAETALHPSRPEKPTPVHHLVVCNFRVCQAARAQDLHTD